jgi:hypothetical protein
MADQDDKVEGWWPVAMGECGFLSRTSLDAKVLSLLELNFGQWVEWAPSRGAVSRGTRAPP